jgi:CheY-like chemotaxis protein
MIDDAHKPFVLVVDDDWINRELMETVLTSAGYRAQTVSTGEKALEIIPQHPPAMVILDLRLSDMSGLEVCERIRALQLPKHIVIVMMSALDNDATRAAALAAGADEFFSKLFLVSELIEKLNRLLPPTTSSV